MSNKVLNITKESIPELIKNTHVSISLEGWPASAAIIAICVSGVALFSIKTFW